MNLFPKFFKMSKKKRPQLDKREETIKWRKTELLIQN